MTKEEAIKKLNAIKEYLIAGNPIWDVREIDEVFDMAVEELQARTDVTRLMEEVGGLRRRVEL